MRIPLICLGFGCLVVAALESPRESASDEAKAPSLKTVNYAQHVAPILSAHCVNCHRPGEVAPFSLVGYVNARKWATMVNTVTESKKMPPWKAVHGYGDFLEENRLSATEIETLKRWEEAGTPRGNPTLEPPAPKPAPEWPLGTPDLILQADKEFHLAAEGADVYRNFVMKNDFKEPVWVTGMTVKPGNRKVVHHMMAFLDNTGVATQKEAAQTDGQPGYSSFGGPGFAPAGSLGVWVPGLNNRLMPEGKGFRIDPGTKIVLQVHYHRTGKPETDRTRVGIYLAKHPVVDVMHLRYILNIMLRIPAGDRERKVSMTSRIGQDVTLWALFPHMHLLGKSMKAWVELPDGSQKPLIEVRDWDFNWQLNYLLKEPMKIPAGSTIRVEAIYDNSTGNPRNPSNPPKDVRFGEQTTDEMMLLMAAYTVDRK